MAESIPEANMGDNTTLHTEPGLAGGVICLHDCLPGPVNVAVITLKPNENTADANWDCWTCLSSALLRLRLSRDGKQ